MNETAVEQGFTRAGFQAFLDSRDEPGWLRDLRNQYFDKFEEMPAPGNREEEWRRTDIRLLNLNKFAWPTEKPAPGESAGLLTLGVELAGHTVSLNSHCIQEELSDQAAAQGVIFGSLDRLAREHGDLVREHLFTRTNQSDRDRFAALHTAWFSGGTFLYVPPGVKLKQPLHMLSQLTDGGVDLGHTLVVLGEGADATLLAETAGGEKSGLHCGAVELFVGPGARLRYVNLQNWGLGTWHFSHQKALVDREARLQWTIGALGSRLAKVNQHVALVGEGAKAQVNGAMFTEGKQHLSYHTLQHHEVPNGTSDLLYKGALQDNSRIVWRGMIKVDPEAQSTNGYQRDDNLILSDHARADSIPGLEIEADDVICTHGATAGRVEEQLIFYAMCRGLTRKEATRMIVGGFFQKVFDRITIDSVREALSEAIGRRIRQYD